MRKQLLRIEPDTSFSLLGIHCHFKDFRFAWLINRVLNKKYRKIDPFILPRTKAEFSRYQDTNESENTYIFSNTSVQGFLVPKKKNVNYWLFINEKMEKEGLNYYQKLMNNSQHILAVFEEKDKKIKEQFLF